MNIPIFYFSGTGNTWYCATEIVKSLQLKNHNVTLFSIESKDLKKVDILKKIVDNADIIGIGYPVHGSDSPEIIKEFIRTMPYGNKPVFSFCTQMMVSGNGGTYIKENIEENGKFLKWAIHFIMPCPIDIPNLVIFKIPSKFKIDKMLAEANKKIQKFVSMIDQNISWFEGQKKINGIFSQMSRSMFSIEISHYSKKLYCNMDRCTKCDYCIEICPSQNISYNKHKEEIIFKSKCDFCLRCYNFCPVKAINLKLNIISTEDCKRYKGPILRFDPRVMQK